MNKKVTIFLLSLFALSAFFTLMNYGMQEKPAGDPSYLTGDLSSCSLVELENDRIALTIPPDYVAGATQEDLNRTAAELSYESILLNEDGSATYTITAEQHKDLLDNLADGIRQKLAAIPASDDYGNISSVEANEDFTKFTVTLSTNNTGFTESMSVTIFKTYGTMYNAFNGITDETITVEYYNQNGVLVASYASTPSEE